MAAVVFLFGFLQQNTTASLLKLYFNDSMQSANCVRAQRRRQSTKRGRDGPMSV